MELKENDKLKTPHAIEAAAEVEAARRSFKKKANRNSVIKRLEAVSSSGVDAVSLLLVRRPKAVIFGVIFLTILGVGITVACNFSLSKPTEYDWEVPDDKFTLLRDMIEDASDETDEAAALRVRGDATFPFYFMYDAEPKFRDTCDGPAGILTARNVQAMCEAERVFTGLDKYQDYCVLDTAGACIDGELRYARVDARVSMDNLAPVSDKKDCLERSNALLSDVRALARGVDGLPKVFQFSRAWLWYKCQIALVHGLLVGISIAFPVAFVVLAVATQNVVLALFAITCIGCIVAGVLGLCFLCGWSLGIRESVAGVIVIGLAVDYTIHLGHMYDHGRIHENLATREDRTKYAMRKMGHTVFAGAITTAGSASLMLLCQLTFFVQMALLIVFTISFSIFMALLFFVPLLWAFGPQGDQGNLLHIWTSLRARWARRGPDVGSLFLPDDEPDDDAAESKEDTAVVPSGDTAL